MSQWLVTVKLYLYTYNPAILYDHVYSVWFVSSAKTQPGTARKALGLRTMAPARDCVQLRLGQLGFAWPAAPRPRRV